MKSLKQRKPKVTFDLSRRSVLLASLLWPSFGLAQGVRRDLPPSLASLLYPQRPGGVDNFGRQRGSRPPGLPEYTAVVGNRFQLIWADKEANSPGRVVVAKTEVVQGIDEAILPLPAAGPVFWQLLLADGRAFGGEVRRLDDAETEAVRTGLDRAERSGAGNETQTALLILDVYAQHDLYMTALRYLVRRGALRTQPPFNDIEQALRQRMGTA